MNESRGRVHGGTPMSDASQTTKQAAIEASMKWTTVNSPPDVTLSFDGKEQPLGLLSDLAAIGWNVPVAPSRPSSAIDWTPDPVAGTEYTILPWRVRQFQLLKRAWAPEVAESIGALTYQTLRRHGAHITGTQQMLDALAGSEAGQTLDQAQTPARQGSAAEASPAAATGPVGAPQVILIDYRGEVVNGLHHQHATTDGRKRTIIGWSESSHGIDALCPDSANRAALFGNANAAWSVHYAQEPPVPTAAGQSALCAVIPGMKTDDSKLTKFVSMLGGQVTIAGLVPLDQRTTESSALIIGIVAAGNAELISSNVRLRFRKAIVRLEQ